MEPLPSTPNQTKPHHTKPPQSTPNHTKPNHCQAHQTKPHQMHPPLPQTKVSHPWPTRRNRRVSWHSCPSYLPSWTSLRSSTRFTRCGGHTSVGMVGPGSACRAAPGLPGGAAGQAHKAQGIILTGCVENPGACQLAKQQQAHKTTGGVLLLYKTCIGLALCIHGLYLGLAVCVWPICM